MSRQVNARRKRLALPAVTELCKCGRPFRVCTGCRIPDGDTVPYLSYPRAADVLRDSA